MPFKKGKSGNPKGRGSSKNKKTLEKIEHLKMVQQEILKEIKPLLRAALNSATGLTVMYQRKKVKNIKGKYERTGELQRVTDPYRVEQLLRRDQTGDDWYYITTKDPNIQALENLFNRVFGKVQESMDITSGGNPIPLYDLRNVRNNNSNRENIESDKKT